MISRLVVTSGMLLSVAGCAGTTPGAEREAPPGRAARAASEPAVAWDAADRIRGLSLSAPRREMAPDALRPVAALGANWVAVVPYAFLDPNDPSVRFDYERQFWGETSRGVAQTIQYARSEGLSILLKPHLWVRGQGWPGEFLPRSDPAWDRFLSGYSDYILRFAALAEALDVEMLSIGTEVDLVAIARPDYWRQLIARVREVYGGTLTYAANWDQYAEIEFWDALDLVGVDAYFPLVAGDEPGLEDLIEAWQPWVDELRRVAARSGKPILFAEFGYRSLDGAAGAQWELPDGRRARGLPANANIQATAYEALFRVWWDRPWFAGGFAWKWYPGSPGGEWIATDYSPQGKLAETVLATWYSGDAAPATGLPEALLLLP